MGPFLATIQRTINKFEHVGNQKPFTLIIVDCVLTLPERNTGLELVISTRSIDVENKVLSVMTKH